MSENGSVSDHINEFNMIVSHINMTDVAEGASGSCLWHNRLGHVSTKVMKMLVGKGAL